MVVVLEATIVHQRAIKIRELGYLSVLSVSATGPIHRLSLT